MSITAERKIALINLYARKIGDTGSPEVQIALLSQRINGLGQHFNSHKADHASRRGLLKMVNTRRKLLDYLKTNTPDRYVKIIGELGLRR